MTAPRRFALAVLALALALPAGRARAELGSPDASYREAQLALRDAVRDTVEHAADAGRFDVLGGLLLRLARFNDATKVFAHVVALRPDDGPALAGLGHIALCQQRLGAADSLLLRAGDAEGAAHDRYVLALRRHDWAAAAAQAEAQEEPGRREMLEHLATLGEPAPVAGPERVVVPFVRAWPAPLVRVQVNGQTVLAVVDLSASELLLDASTARLCHVQVLPGERSVPWDGSRVAARNGSVRRLALGAAVLADVPVAIAPLHRYSLEVNPEGESVGAVIGVPVLERFGVTLDFRKQQLELRRPGVAYAPAGEHLPFERWGENELMVYGSIDGGRRLALWLGTGLPNAGIGAPQGTFDEAGIQPGKFANFVRGVGTALQGRPWSQVMVSTLSVGPVVKDRVEGWSGAMDAGELWRHGVRRDALLGPKFFAGRRVTLDWDRHELVFEGDD